MAFIPTTPLPNRTPAAHPSLNRRSPPVQMSLKVLLTGASGRTGRIVLDNLVSNPADFSPKGLVRSISRTEQSLPPDQFHKIQSSLVEGDILHPDTFNPHLHQTDALVILTSAIPKMNPTEEGQPPTFTFDKDGMPEQVDWIGARNQIDSAKQAQVKHIVLVGSMGSTDEQNPLNRVGNGNILRFKRKAEMYLIDSGVPYTIINPAGLINDPPEERELVAGKNDELFEIYGQRSCSIPRADVARVVVSALTCDNARNKVFDIVARPKGDGSPTTDVSALFENAPATL